MQEGEVFEEMNVYCDESSQKCLHNLFNTMS